MIDHLLRVDTDLPVRADPGIRVDPVPSKGFY
jgi:hypothetical protein